MLAFMAVSAQQAANDYIVKTKNVKKSVVTEQVGEDGKPVEQAEEKAHDFISDHFKFYSLCDWQEGMKFMVMPERYDMVVKTFRDADTGKEVSSMKLRHKIMIYKDHTEGADGHDRINFLCQDDNKLYYYEIPSGTFDDYCYGKLGVPTLAYLGDVDIARELLMNKKMFTNATLYRIDTENDGDGFQEVAVTKGIEVEVVKIGVGSRSFPVKIIVQDKNGNEFYQSVAISKTNSGMRDDEFIMDNTKYLFGGSFELEDVNLAAARGYNKYLHQPFYTKYTTKMTIINDDGTESTPQISRLTTFVIEGIRKTNDTYFTLTLKDKKGQIYYKDVTFENVDVAGDIAGRREDFFDFLFAAGAGANFSNKVREAIDKKEVTYGMTKDEVNMSVGTPDQTGSDSSTGNLSWFYHNVKGQPLTVLFNSAGKVVSINGKKQPQSGGKKRPVNRRR